MSLNVRVITPDKVVWDADTEELILPSSTGQLGILTDHAPLLTALDIGVMRLKTGTNWTSIVLMEGFAEIENNDACQSLLNHLAQKLPRVVLEFKPPWKIFHALRALMRHSWQLCRKSY